MRTLIDGTPGRHGAPSLDELRAIRSQLLEVCARNGASPVAVFGSVARGEQDSDSHLDLVLDIEDVRSPFDLAGLIDERETLLGCRVNLGERCMLQYDSFGRRRTPGPTPALRGTSGDPTALEDMLRYPSGCVPTPRRARLSRG